MAASDLHAQLQQLLSRSAVPMASQTDHRATTDTNTVSNELHAALQALLREHRGDGDYAGSLSFGHDDGSVTTTELFSNSSVSDQERAQHVQQSAPVTAKRPRQTGGSRTYYMRKEEKTSLQFQMQLLQAQVAYLQSENQFLSSHPHLRLFIRDPALLNKQAVNEAMLETVQSQQLAFAGLQSAYNKHVSTESPLPFRSCIRLGKNWHERDATLLAMKDRKLQSAQLYLAERTRFLDLCVPFTESSRFVTPEGNLSSLRFDIVLFEGVKSVKQVFDALLFYFFNMEISVSEMLGDITIREEDDIRQQGISQSRLISNVREDVQVEINSIIFCKLYESSEVASGGDFGVVVADSITDDALYPYSPATRLRNDITAAVTLSLEPRKRRNPVTRIEEDPEFIVVMKRTCMQSLLHTELPFSDKEMEGFRENFDGWANTMITSMRNTLYSSQHASTVFS